MQQRVVLVALFDVGADEPDEKVWHQHNIPLLIFTVIFRTALWNEHIGGLLSLVW